MEAEIKKQQDSLSKESRPAKIAERQKTVEELEKTLSQCMQLSRSIELLDSLLESDYWEDFQVSNLVINMYIYILFAFLFFVCYVCVCRYLS
jgi:hypothetical protein